MLFKFNKSTLKNGIITIFFDIKINLLLLRIICKIRFYLYVLSNRKRIVAIGNYVKKEVIMSVDEIFDKLLNSDSIFKNKRVLSHDYVPEILPHREREIQKLAYILATALKGGKPSNVFMYGKTGTGKTAVARYVLKKLSKKGERLGLDLSYAYVNCRYRKTNYRVLIKICDEIGCAGLPETGLPTDAIFDKLIRYIDAKEKLVIIILDELDWLVKTSGDDVLYQLTRINNELERSQVSLIGITNDLKFREYLDSRVLSSLSEESIVFSPYNAQQIYDILKQRAEMAFVDGVVDDAALKLAAAIAAQEHGDARRAIDLLRVAGEIVERQGDNKLHEKHIVMAKDEVEKDLIEMTVRELPLQEQLILLAILKAYSDGKNQKVTTGVVKGYYEEICVELGYKPVTLRRINDIISDLEMLGIISAPVVSMGRYGRTKLIRIEVPLKSIAKVFERDDKFSIVLKERK